MKMTKNERKEIRNNYKEAKKAYRKSTRVRRIVLTVCLVLLVTLFASAYADSVPAAEVEAMQTIIKQNDVAKLPDTAVMGTPDVEEPAFGYSASGWCEGDTERILFFGLNYHGFDAVAKNNEGFEDSKVQDCIVVEMSETDNTITCEAPDGSLYTVTNEYGMNVGDKAVLCFLLKADPAA